MRNLLLALAHKLFNTLDRFRPVSSLRWGYSYFNDCKLLCDAYGFMPKVVYDVGANDGRTYRRFRLAFHSPLIVCVEPNERLWDHLERVAQDDSHFVLARCALGASLGSALLRFYGKEGSSEQASSNLSSISDRPMFTEAFDYQHVGAAEVPLETVDHLATTLGHSFIDILKIDVEGYEPDVLEGAFEMLSSSSIAIVDTEFSGVLAEQHQAGSLELIAKKLQPYGFTMVAVSTDFVVHGNIPYANHNAVWVNPRACARACSRPTDH